MSEEIKEYTIELGSGYAAKDAETKKEIVHRSVTFGRRLMTQDLINLDNNPQAQNPTQYNDLVRRRMITKFGTLPMPVSLGALLSLDSIDREDLAAAADKFTVESRGETFGEIRENGDVKLRFGFQIGETNYDVVQFGKLTTGRDEVDADALGPGIARYCCLIGRQITKISTSDGTASINGAVSVEKFYTLDAEDFNQLRIGAKMFEVAFRIKRKSLSEQRNGNDRLRAGKGNEDVGSGSAGNADGTD